MVLDKNFETFVMHIVILKTPLAKILVYLDKKAQITFLFIKRITIWNKYSDFTDVFFKKRR